MGTPTYAAGRYGQGARFDGSSDDRQKGATVPADVRAAAARERSAGGALSAGAAVGDVSRFDYSTPENLSFTHADGDYMEVNRTSGSSS